MRLVVIESPLRGRVPGWCPRWLAPLVERIARARNRAYAKRCMLDALSRGEAPYASHLLFDQRGLLDDANHEQRLAGIEAGFAWGHKAQLRAVYCDRGISYGMKLGMQQRPAGQLLEFRQLRPRRQWRPEDVQ